MDDDGDDDEEEDVAREKLQQHKNLSHHLIEKHQSH